MSKLPQIEETGATIAPADSNDDRFAAIFDEVSDGIFIADSTTGKFIEVNRSGCRMFGYSKAEIIGQNIAFLSSGIHPYTLEMAIEHNRKAQKRRREGHVGKIEPFEWQARTKDGRLFWVEMSLRPTEFAREPATVAVVRDITERKRLGDRIAYMAEHDTLTGLPNRSNFTAALERALNQARRTGKSFSVLFLDLDRFKQVNDDRGHAVGDELLRLVAARLQQSLRPNETIARFGGDEFATLLGNPMDAEEIEALAKRLIAAVNEPFSIDGREVHVGLSIGAATYGKNASEADALLSQADIAMYRAKAEGRNTVRFYNDSMREDARSRVA